MCNYSWEWNTYYDIILLNENSITLSKLIDTIKISKYNRNKIKEIAYNRIKRYINYMKIGTITSKILEYLKYNELIDLIKNFNMKTLDELMTKICMMSRYVKNFIDKRKTK